MSPEKKSLSTENLAAAAEGPQRVAPPLRDIENQEPIFAPEAEEIRVSPVVARKGWLNFLEEKTKGWTKKWVVCQN